MYERVQLVKGRDVRRVRCRIRQTLFPAPVMLQHPGEVDGIEAVSGKLRAVGVHDIEPRSEMRDERGADAICIQR